MQYLEKSIKLKNFLTLFAINKYTLWPACDQATSVFLNMMWIMCKLAWHL